MFSAFFKKNPFEIQANLSNVERYLEKKKKKKKLFKCQSKLIW